MSGHMPGAVLAAVLFAALMHASWNALVKSRSDTALATVLVVAGGGLLGAMALPFLPAPARESWPFIAASSVAQLAYYTLLVETYSSGDMSLSYPLMRGSAPLLVALVNGPLTGEHLSGAQWLAVGLICGGIFAMYESARSGSARGRRTTAFALATACIIATYTMIDGAGVRHSGAPAAYTIWIFLFSGMGALAWAAMRRGPDLLPFARANLPLVVIGGVTTLGSYGIALWAMTLAPVAAVAALRETSILFATAIAALVLGERVSPARLSAVALVACGAVAMRLA
ncbi:EamA family transporter [Massilia terrae]|uniref:EamA family transporter n=1 Tax=Massilia terrae TaxID=1811224 RepID=A0ABT2CV12_9BURK|nr:EamA family transporter [Massilia terrae]MCS0657679.1 EamA family transporter [Massilia terrae]